MALTKEQAQALAPIVLSSIKKHATELLNSLDDADKREMHPQALAALGGLADIRGEFCHVAPTIDKAISDIGWLAKMILGGAYALLIAFQDILKQMQAVLCLAPA